MKTYEITIKPVSGFGTPLKGDTLFGHICWQAYYDPELFGMSIDKLLDDYGSNPFLVVSTAFPKIGNGYALKRPDMPLDMLFEIEKYNEREIIGKRKEIKNKKWMYLEKSSRLQSLKADDLYLKDEELFQKLIVFYEGSFQRSSSKHGSKSLILDFTQPHNTINRLTGTTGEGQFAPYSVEQKVFLPGIELSVFVGIREDITVDSVKEAFNRIGKTGFGKDASTGLGRFDVGSVEEINLMSLGAEQSNACYTLSPCVLNKDSVKDVFFAPFIRFGRHGDRLAKSGKPFKNPVIMADEGAVVLVKDKAIFNKPYIGSMVKGISKVQPKAVTQGYSLYIPVKVEDKDE